MPSKGDEFRLVSSTAPSGKKYWRAYITDMDTGVRIKPSTGIEDDGTDTARAHAAAAALTIIKALRQGPDLLPASGTLFGDLIRGLWEWGKSLWLRARLARDPMAVSQETAYNSAALIRKHVLTYLVTAPGPARGRLLVDLALDLITADVLDGLVTDKLEQGLSSQTVKHLVQAMAPAFDLAIRRRLIHESPIPLMIPFTARHRARSPFTLPELRALLDPGKVAEVWGDPTSRYLSYRDGWRMYALTALLAVTGVRFGTMVALTRERIIRGPTGAWYELVLEESVTPMGGLKSGTKTGSGTRVPVAARIMDTLLPHLPAAGPVWIGFGKTGYLGHHTAVGKIHEALDRIGVPRDEQARRLLGFHSLRHSWVTRARAAGISKEVRRAFTEHRGESEERYAHPAAADLVDVLPLQIELLG